MRCVLHARQPTLPALGWLDLTPPRAGRRWGGELNCGRCRARPPAGLIIIIASPAPFPSATPPLAPRAPRASRASRTPRASRPPFAPLQSRSCAVATSTLTTSRPGSDGSASVQLRRLRERERRRPQIWFAQGSPFCPPRPQTWRRSRRCQPSVGWWGGTLCGRRARGGWYM